MLPRQPRSFHTVQLLVPWGSLHQPWLCFSLSSVQVNDWQRDWVMFYAQQRIQPQMDMVAKGSGDREALELWSALQVSGAALCPVPAMPCSPHRPLWV